MSKLARKAAAGLCLLVISCLLPGAASAENVDISDPLEPMNRGVFWFNDQLDIYLVEPVARGYDWLLPNPVQNSIGNFFKNLAFPSYLVSDLVQLKFQQACSHTLRFAVNTTAGVAGLFDVAKHLGFEHHYEDFGTALGYNGLPSGPYLVLPLLGPSNVRDGFGRIVDIFLNPVYHLSATDMHRDTAFAISASLTVLDAVDTRAGMLEAVEAGKEASLDFYLFAQSAYEQKRQSLIYDSTPELEEDPLEDEEDWEEKDREASQ